MDTDCHGYQDVPSGCECGASGMKVEMTCNDGIDNDGDGFIDCDDTDCIGLVSCPASIEEVSDETTCRVEGACLDDTTNDDCE